MIKPKTWVETLIITYFLSQSNLGGEVNTDQGREGRLGHPYSPPHFSCYMK